MDLWKLHGKQRRRSLSIFTSRSSSTEASPTLAKEEKVCKATDEVYVPRSYHTLNDYPDINSLDDVRQQILQPFSNFCGVIVQGTSDHDPALTKFWGRRILVTQGQYMRIRVSRGKDDAHVLICVKTEFENAHRVSKTKFLTLLNPAFLSPATNATPLEAKELAVCAKERWSQLQYAPGSAAVLTPMVISNIAIHPAFAYEPIVVCIEKIRTPWCCNSSDKKKSSVAPLVFGLAKHILGTEVTTIVDSKRTLMQEAQQSPELVEGSLKSVTIARNMTERVTSLLGMIRIMSMEAAQNGGIPLTMKHSGSACIFFACCIRMGMQAWVWELPALTASEEFAVKNLRCQFGSAWESISTNGHEMGIDVVMRSTRDIINSTVDAKQKNTLKENAAYLAMIGLETIDRLYGFVAMRRASTNTGAKVLQSRLACVDKQEPKYVRRLDEYTKSIPFCTDSDARTTVMQMLNYTEKSARGLFKKGCVNKAAQLEFGITELSTMHMFALQQGRFMMNHMLHLQSYLVCPSVHSLCANVECATTVMSIDHVIASAYNTCTLCEAVLCKTCASLGFAHSVEFSCRACSVRAKLFNPQKP